jgi:hypothetical protein
VSGSVDQRLAGALAAIDRANGADPNVVTLLGRTGPKELVHSQRMTEWLLLIDPDASAEQRLAARAHHLRRWLRPRADYPEGRPGYLRWRADAKRAHASDVANLLTEAGYDQAVVDDVGAIIQKVGLARDPRVQTHEDALCLTFLEAQLDELNRQLGDDHMVSVLQKTVAKMSPGAVQLAAAIPLSTHGADVVARALADVSTPDATPPEPG